MNPKDTWPEFKKKGNYSPHKKVKKKLDRFLGAQNRNDATATYCPVYWHAKEPTADFSSCDGFCVKKSILSAL
jgi:hypothetical protein